MVNRGVGEPTALAASCIVDLSAESGRLPLSTSPRIGNAQSCGSVSRSHARRGQHHKHASSQKGESQAHVTPRSSARGAPPLACGENRQGSNSARKCLHRDSAEGIPLPSSTASSSTSSTGIIGSHDASVVADSDNQHTSVVGMSLGSLSGVDACSDVRPSSSQSASSLRASSSASEIHSVASNSVDVSSGCAAIYEDYAEDDALAVSSPAERDHSVAHSHAQAHFKPAVSWDDEVAEELEEECSPIPRDRCESTPSECFDDSPCSSGNGVVVAAAVAAMQHGTSPYDSYDENDFCAYDEGNDDILRMGGSELCHTIAAAEEASGGCMQSLLFHLQSSAGVEADSTGGGGALSDSSCSLLSEETHPFTWQSVDIVPGPLSEASDNQEHNYGISWSNAIPSSLLSEREPMFEAPSVMSVVRHALEELDQRSANGDVCAASLYFHPFLCMEAQQQEMRMHRSTLHYEYCSAEVRKQEISVQDRVIMIKSLLYEAHRHHTVRLAAMGHTHLPLPPHRVHGLRNHAARVQGWKAIAAEVERTLVMEGPLMTQRKLSCMCIFNPHRADAPSASPEGGDEERSRRLERQELLLQRIAEKRGLFAPVNAGSYLPPESVREGVHTPMCKAADCSSFDTLNSLLLSQSVGIANESGRDADAHQLNSDDAESGEYNDAGLGLLERLLRAHRQDRIGDNHDDEDIEDDDDAFRNYAHIHQPSDAPPVPSYMVSRSS